jgi:malonyl-CoA/methylmalonyl-CoA synthetase
MANPLYDALFAPLKSRDTDVLILADEPPLSGAEFYQMIAGLGAGLRAAGVVKGDRVAAQVAKSPKALALYAATVAVGAIFLPLNTAYTAAELDYFLTNATPKLFFGDQQGGLCLTDFGADPNDFTPIACDHDDLAAILYTSGTTGRSKGAMLSHGNLLSNAQVLVEAWRFTARDTLLHALPIFHTHGLFVASNVSLLSGGQMIFLPNFDAKTVLAHLGRATVLMGVPTFYTRLLDLPDFDGAATAHMRLFTSGSAPLLAETHVQFAARTGHRILERYGMTETNMNTSNPYEGERRAGTVGLPLAGVELRLSDVQDGVGMIQVRGPNVFSGYWQMPEKTAEELTPDGWFITGDLGQTDADGYLTIVGRSKDLVISGGYNIYPKEIEMVLDACDGVVESAVIGLPHPDLGEAVFAVLTGPADVDQVLASLTEQLARFKQPKAGVVIAELPRNTMGKVQKAALRQIYADWFSTSKT